MYVHVPAEFEADYDDDYMDNQGYFSYHKKYGNDIIYFNFNVDVRFSGVTILNDDGIDEYNLKDVPEITFNGDLTGDTIFSRIKSGFEYIYEEHYMTDSNYCEKIVDSEKYQTINGRSFINEKGIFTLEHTLNADDYPPLELNYTAYYTILKCPRREHNNAEQIESGLAFLIVFSDKCTEETKKELDRVALEMIINSDWDSYCNNDTYFNSHN